MYYISLGSGISVLGYGQVGILEAIMTIVRHNICNRCFFWTVATVRANMSINVQKMIEYV